jgi:phytoene synthase
MAVAERLALAYAPAAFRERLIAGFSLDAALRHAALGKSETLLAQVRLAWWRDACARIPAGTQHPVLVALGQIWRGSNDPLVALVDAWEAVAVAADRLVDPAEELAEARAGVFAALTGALADERVIAATRCWTLATLADLAPNEDAGELMRSRAAAIPNPRLPRALRSLAVLHGLARRAAAAGTGLLLGDRASPFVAMRLGIFGR